MFTVYIIQSKKNNHYYIGVTQNLHKRMSYHNGNQNRSTKNKGPWILVHSENFIDKRLAWLREKQVKSYKGGEAFHKLLKMNNN